MKYLLSLLLLIPSLSFSQGLAVGEKEFVYPEFKDCGLVSRYASNKIGPGCLTQALNVYLDEDFSVKRRNGYSKYNATPCTDSKAIRGMWNFDSTDGQKYVIINSSTSFFYTKNQGDCTRLSGLSGLNATADWDCIQALGSLWCINGIDNGFGIDSALTVTSYPASGSSPSSTPSLPLGTSINTFRNRLVVSGISGEQSRIRLSGEGNGTDWEIKIPGQSTSPASIDISGTNDGKPVVGLMGQYQNAFWIGREFDISALYGNDRRDFTLRQLSNQVGLLDKRSVKEKDNSLIWLSRRGVEKAQGTTMERASDVIRPEIDQIIKATGNSRTKQYNTQTDWEAGLYDTQVDDNGPTSTTIYPGSVVPSTWSHIDTSASDWTSGTLSFISTGTSGSIKLQPVTTTTVLLDNFTDGDYTGNPTWTCYNPGSYDDGCSALSITSGGLRSAVTLTSLPVSTYRRYDSMAYTPNSVDISETKIFNSSFSIVLTNTRTNSNVTCLNTSYVYPFSSTSVPESGNNWFYVSVTYNLGTPTYTGAIVYNHDGTLTTESDTLTSASCTDINVTLNNTAKTITATDSGCGMDITLTIPTGSEIESTEYYLIRNFESALATTLGLSCQFTQTADNITSSYNGYTPYGTFTSPVYDTTFSTPVGGPFDYTEDVPVGSTIAYSVRQATWSYNGSGDVGSWNVISTTTSGAYRIPLTQRYWQYKADFSTSYSTQSPSVDDISLEATTTGYYIGDCVNVSSITKWGNFRPVSLTSGNNTMSYWVSSGTSCNEVTRSTANWQVQLPNSSVVLSTNVTYVGFKTFFNVDTTTHSSRLDGLTFEWNEGESRPAVASIVYRDRYYMFYTTVTTASQPYNDHALVLDNADKWTQFDDVFVNAAVLYDNQLYTGDSRDTGQIHIQDGPTDYADDTSTFTFKIKTSDYDFGNPIEKKQLQRVYIILKQDSAYGSLIDVNVNYYINGSTTAYSLGEALLSEGPEDGYFIAKFPVPVDQPSTFNWLSISLDYPGEQGPLSIYQIRLIYKPIRIE